MIPEAEDLFRGVYAALRPAFVLVCEAMEERGARAYVKTQYVGFDLGGELVAAAHPRDGEVIELALALPEDYDDNRLIDASHLKWRTLPVAVRIRSEDDFAQVHDLIGRALDRVAAREHDVALDNTRFASRPRYRSGN